MGPVFFMCGEEPDVVQTTIYVYKTLFGKRHISDAQLGRGSCLDSPQHLASALTIRRGYQYSSSTRLLKCTRRRSKARLCNCDVRPLVTPSCADISMKGM